MSSQTRPYQGYSMTIPVSLFGDRVYTLRRTRPFLRLAVSGK